MPVASPVACGHRGCSNTTAKGNGGLCSEHQRARHKQYSQTRNDQEHTKIYSTKAWKTTRRNALYRDEGWCVICKEAPAVLVDHIKEIKDGGEPYLLSNLQSLCARCHNKKTAEVAKNRLR